MTSRHELGVHLPAFEVIADELPPPPFYPQAKAFPARPTSSSSLRPLRPAAQPASRASSAPARPSRSQRSQDAGLPVAMQHAVQYANRAATATTTGTGAETTSSRASLLSAARKHARRAAFEALAKLSLTDHVAALMQQPLPMKGYKAQEGDYKKTSSAGPLPMCPLHMMMPQTTTQTLSSYGPLEEAACRGIRSAQWHGYQKNGNSAYNEQVVYQSHLMRK